MSMLDRYRRTGGFVQLLKVLETCGEAKQAKFLEIIRSEDALWADAIERKILHFETIFTWNSDAIGEIVGTLQDLTIAIILHGASPEVADKIRATFTHARQRRIDDLCATNKPTPAEILTMELKVVETVRQMGIDGYLRFDKIDPDVAIEDGVEERLLHGKPLPHERRSGRPKATEPKRGHAQNQADPRAEGESEGDSESEGPREEPGTGLDFSMAAGLGGSPPDSAELAQLRKRVIDLGKENASLRHELATARGKLDQIKKIA
jgi:hypothetical protein